MTNNHSIDVNCNSNLIQIQKDMQSLFDKSLNEQQNNATDSGLSQ